MVVAGTVFTDMVVSMPNIYTTFETCNPGTLTNLGKNLIYQTLRHRGVRVYLAKQYQKRTRKSPILASNHPHTTMRPLLCNPGISAIHVTAF